MLEQLRQISPKICRKGKKKIQVPAVLGTALFQGLLRSPQNMYVYTVTFVNIGGLRPSIAWLITWYVHSVQ
jgi:hypothetical protein